MGKEKRYAIDHDRLKSAIKKTGKSMRKASVEIGCAGNYLAQAGFKGFTTKQTLVALNTQFGISYEEIKPVKNKETQPDRSYIKQLIPETNDERWFDVISEIKMIGIHLNTSTQQYDEIIDLLIRQNALLAELVEMWKPDTSKAC